MRSDQAQRERLSGDGADPSTNAIDSQFLFTPRRHHQMLNLKAVAEEESKDGTLGRRLSDSSSLANE